MQVALWQFPRADFADWCELIGSPQCADYDEYLTLLAAVQADQERQGQSVRRVTMTVAEMRQHLTPAHPYSTPRGQASG